MEVYKEVLCFKKWSGIFIFGVVVEVPYFGLFKKTDPPQNTNLYKRKCKPGSYQANQFSPSLYTIYFMQYILIVLIIQNVYVLYM